MTINDKYPWLEKYLLSKKGVEKDYKAEWNWERFMIRGKMFTAFCYDKDGNIVYITVKSEPDFNFMLRNTYDNIIPGYYMNKEHWNSIVVAGKDIPDDVVKEMCDRGYNLILNSFSKKVRADISGVE